MKSIIPIIAVLAILSAGPANKAATGDILIVSNSVCYVLSQDANGVPTLTKATQQYSQVIVMGQPGPQPPTPPNPPLPPIPPVSDYAKQIQRLASAATSDPDRANSAMGLAELYRQIAKLARDGTIKDSPTLQRAVTAATDTFLAPPLRDPAAKAAWKPVRDAMGTQWTVLTAKSAPINDYAALLDDTAFGLDASVAGAMSGVKTISPELLALIMQIIQLILSLLNK